MQSSRRSCRTYRRSCKVFYEAAKLPSQVTDLLLEAAELFSQAEQLLLGALVLLSDAAELLTEAAELLAEDLLCFFLTVSGITHEATLCVQEATELLPETRNFRYIWHLSDSFSMLMLSNLSSYLSGRSQGTRVCSLDIYYNISDFRPKSFK